MGQQHGFGKARKVQPGDLGHLPEFVGAVRGQNLPVCHARQLDLGGLQGSVCLVARAALAPEGAVGDAFDLELHFREAFGLVARHHIIAAGADGGKARRLVVQRQADGIEQGGLACARGAGDGKQAVVGKGRGGEVHRPFALE